MKRLEWLDAMRGFTMILVVTYHVAHMSFGITDRYSSAQPLLVLFRMPLFFFVSGFLAYKASLVWSGKTLGTLLLKKTRIQLLPTLVFLCISLLLLRQHFDTAFVSAMKSATKGGYWFTWVLLQMFVIHYCCSYVASLLPRRRWMPSVQTVLFVIFLALYALTYMPPVMKWLGKDVEHWLNYTSLIQTLRYMPFFLFGTIVRKNWEAIQRLMDTSWFFPVIAVIAFFSAGDFLRWHLLRRMWANLPHTLAAFSLLLLVVMFFRRYKDSFSHDTNAGRMLQYIGTRTLDIYLLHYLFLPSLPMVGVWFNAHRHNFALELLVTVAGALVVIALCCVTSSLLRVSPVFKKYLFGR